MIPTWLGRLVDIGLITLKGRTKGTEYLVNPEFLKNANFKGNTNLKRMENHRLTELIYQDVKIYQPTPIRDIHTRIGEEISKNKIQKALKVMCDKGIIESQGVLKGTKYFIRQKE